MSSQAHDGRAYKKQLGCEYYTPPGLSVCQPRGSAETGALGKYLSGSHS